MIKLKKGVRLLGLATEMAVALMIVAKAYEEIDKGCIITSGVEGRHSHGSDHYKGDALDFRTRHLHPVQAETLAMCIEERLGDDFDVVLEATHLHVEFDPKSPY